LTPNRPTASSKPTNWQSAVSLNQKVFLFSIHVLLYPVLSKAELIHQIVNKKKANIEIKLFFIFLQDVLFCLSEFFGVYPESFS